MKACLGTLQAKEVKEGLSALVIEFVKADVEIRRRIAQNAPEPKQGPDEDASNYGFTSGRSSPPGIRLGD